MMKTIDLHCDTIAEIQGGADIAVHNPGGHIDIPRLREGGIGAQIFACFISSEVPEEHAFDKTITMLDQLHEFCEKNSAELEVCGNASSLFAVHANSRIGVLAAVENGHAIAGDLNNLEKLRLRNVRYMTLTHSKNLSWAASSAEERCDFEGLTNFGLKVIEAMNELGIIVDLSHVHETTFWKAIRHSKKPVIASHSNSSALCPLARNLTDDQIRAIGDSGGIIGVNFYPGFLSPEYAVIQEERCGELFGRFDQVEREYLHDPVKKVTAMRAISREFAARLADQDVRSDRIIDHLAHIINKGGEDCAGFGSDFDGIPALPSDISGCDFYQSIPQRLLDRGFSQNTVEKICYRNFLRVLTDAD